MNKKLSLALFFALSISFSVFSQEISLRYGRITNDELTMTVYENDTSAVAVVLYENGNFSYHYANNLGFQTMFDYRTKIKILKSEGTDYADITIPYYVGSGAAKEFISGLEAFSYNLENGKVVKTKLTKRYIFNEEVSSNYRLIKFSIPNVKVGTVIEYRYRKTSPFIFDIPDWDMQSEIPVLNSYYEVLIPEYYRFKFDAAKGYERIQVEETTQSQNFSLGVNRSGQPQNVISSSRLLKFTAKNMPALKSEPQVWYVNDFVTGVRFELIGTQYPNDLYRPYTSSWKNIEETLKDKSDFGTNMRMSNPFRNEVRAIVAESESEEETIANIYALAKEKIRWNGNYAFWGSRAREAVRNGTGDNAQINMVLLSMLKDANITAYPVLMSRRNRGRLPFSPSLDKLNTFIVAAETSDGKTFYMDGSAIYGGLNVLPTVLLVDRAWAFDDRKTGDKWVNLTNLGRNQQINILRATIDENGVMTGESQIRYTGQIAYSFKSNYFSKKDSLEYLHDKAVANKITIDTHSIEGLEPMSNVVNEQFTFTKNNEFVGDYLYINPMIFMHLENNPFTQSERKLPIEFPFPYSYLTTVVFTIPEGYAVDEIPVPLNIVLEDNAGRCIYSVTQTSDNTLQLTYRFELNQIIFPQSDYKMIQEFYGQVAAKNAEMIVLKKI
jgi:hypothetical protein